MVEVPDHTQICILFNLRCNSLCLCPSSSPQIKDQPFPSNLYTNFLFNKLNDNNILLSSTRKKTTLEITLLWLIFATMLRSAVKMLKI